MAEESGGKSRSTFILAIQRAVRRPYLFMAAVILILGVIWFFRLAVQEFLLIDRVINVYTNDAQVQMDSYAIRPAVTAEVLEVAVSEGQPVRKGQILLQLAQDDIRAELQKAEAVAEGMAQQVLEMQQEMPLSIERAEQQVVRAQALVETKEQEYKRAQVFLAVESERAGKMRREHQATIDAAEARLREHETAAREAVMTLDRTESLFKDGILSQDRLDAAQLTLERRHARLAAAREEVLQAKEHYPSGVSPQMVRVHQQDVKRLEAALQEQQVTLELARNDLQRVRLGAQRLKVLEAKHKEAQAQVEAYRLKLAKTEIRSPVDGIVAYRNVEPGEIVKGDPSTSPILILHNPRNRWIAANVWESDISRVRLGNAVEIWIDAFRTNALGRGKPFRGKIVRINPTTYDEVAGLPPERFFTRRERKVPVGISIEDDAPGLRAGMLAEVLIYPRKGAEAEEHDQK
jgi:multidrug resistance efflux pump